MREPHRSQRSTSIAYTLANNEAHDSRRWRLFSVAADVNGLPCDSPLVPQSPLTGSGLGTIALLNAALGANTP